MLKLLKVNAVSGEIQLPVSKSLVNRVLILQALFPQIKFSDYLPVADISILQNALISKSELIHLGAAGTAMRFAAAFFASQPGRNVQLIGSARMHKRPIADLVNALNALGADIAYAGEDGFPPLQIRGHSLPGGRVVLPGQVSSQFATALLLVAPTFLNGLELTFSGEVVSRSYINMTVQLMRELGFMVEWSETEIRVEAANLQQTKNRQQERVYTPERDWSAAAFWYGWMAVTDQSKLRLTGLRKKSLQGDIRIATIFEVLGVKTTFTTAGAQLEKRAAQLPKKLVVNLVDQPDLAQPIAFTCAALGIGADLRGLQTLPSKETDRLLAMQTELAKVGVKALVTDRSISFEPTTLKAPQMPFCTYKDHRMAMAISLLASRFAMEIDDPQVVRKSYPGYWHHLESVRH